MVTIYKVNEGQLTILDRNDDGVYEVEKDSILDKNGKFISPDSKEVQAFVKEHCLPQMDGLKLNVFNKYSGNSLLFCENEVQKILDSDVGRRILDKLTPLVQTVIEKYEGDYFRKIGQLVDTDKLLNDLGHAHVAYGYGVEKGKRTLYLLYHTQEFNVSFDKTKRTILQDMATGQSLGYENESGNGLFKFLGVDIDRIMGSFEFFDETTFNHPRIQREIREYLICFFPEKITLHDREGNVHILRVGFNCGTKDIVQEVMATLILLRNSLLSQY